jgi:hypothetical protein
MRFLFVALISAWISGVLLTACGDSSLSSEQFAQEYAAAVCERAGRCGNLAPYQIDQCQAAAQERVHPEDVKRAMAAGRLVYDAEQAQRCIEGIQHTRCLAEDIDDTVLAACQAALRGTVASGGECSFLFECAAGTCGGKAETTCPSTCPEVLSEGDSCSLFRGPPCNANAGLRCSGGMCVRPGDKGASCVDNFGCRSGFVCAGEACAPLATEGAGCSADSSCAEGLYCQDSFCVARKREGQKCSAAPDEVDAALRGAQCNDGLVCQGAGLDSQGNALLGSCVKPSGEGGSCKEAPPDVQTYLSGCLYGLTCVSGRCVLPPSSGPCAADGSCRADQAYCSSNGECVALLPDGAACQIPPECASGNCTGDKCAPAQIYCHE